MLSRAILRQLSHHKYLRKDWICDTSSSMNMRVQPTFRPTSLYSTSKASKLRNKATTMQTLKQSSVKPTRTKNTKTPLWMRNMHAELMESVALPRSLDDTRTDNHDDLSDTVLSRRDSVDQDQLVFALCRNFNSMSVEEILTEADLLYMNGISSSVYAQSMALYFYEMMDVLQLSPGQIVRAVFHVQQLWPVAVPLMVELEARMEGSLPQFTMDQVAWVCQLLFYGQHRFKSMTLVDAIGKKLLNEFDTITPENLPMMMKAFRYSNYIKVSFYKQLGDLLCSNKYLNNFSNAGQIMHFAFVFASVHITHPKLFKLVLTRVQELEQSPRMKDLSKIIWACGTLVTTETEHLERIQAIVDAVRTTISPQQVLRYPDNLMDFLVGLAYLDIYPTDLIEQYLGHDTIQMLLNLDSGRSKFVQLEFLAESLTIECPKFKRKLLSEAHHRELVSHLGHFRADVDMKLRKPMLPAIEALRDAIGEENVHCCFVLPHFKTTDILLEFDQTKKCFVPPQDKRSTNELNSANVKRIIVMLLSKAQTSYDDRPLGMLHCKLRQLRTLGYSVVQISAEEALTYTLMEKKDLQDRLLSHVSRAVDHRLTRHREED
ncbi:hypothetical protein EGW08_000147 [Elysia chlorotica]|uniref:RAP domain-containing protein n=1 Tax=Elysia chlorotica TaxID=188477 RepID=A0A433UEG2_ELYCH|nr:hypothetical protein EGW08_000147 [Elysia chlorotica]